MKLFGGELCAHWNPHTGSYPGHQEINCQFEKPARTRAWAPLACLFIAGFSPLHMLQPPHAPSLTRIPRVTTRSLTRPWKCGRLFPNVDGERIQLFSQLSFSWFNHVYDPATSCIISRSWPWPIVHLLYLLTLEYGWNILSPIFQTKNNKHCRPIMINLN